jgi:glutathione S-transferase
LASKDLSSRFYSVEPLLTPTGSTRLINNNSSYLYNNKQTNKLTNKQTTTTTTRRRMTVTIVAPEHYGYVLLSCVLGQFVASQYMGSQVMNARKKYNVLYPNFYATPGFHKEADAFNRLQRGHMNMFETAGIFSLMALFGGLKHPIAATVSSLLYSVGSALFQVGYADLTLDVAFARYKRGGGLKWVGFFGAMGTFISFCGSACGWFGKTTN